MKEGWTYKKLGEVANFLSGYTPKKNELYPNGDIPYFKVAEMNLLGNEKKLIYTSQFLKETNKIYPKGAIVFPKNGGAVYTEKKRILAQDSVIDLNSEAVVANEDLISTLYLYCLFNHIKISKFDKGGGLPSLDIKRMQEYIVPIPPLSEQQRIVAQLDESFAEIDMIKAEAEKQLSDAKALFQKALSKAMTPKEGWEKKKLGEVCYKSSNIKWNEEKEGKSFHYIDLTSVDRETFSIFDPQIINCSNAPSRAKQIVKSGDIIFATTRPTLKRVCVIPEGYNNQICSTGFCVLRPNSKVLTKWIFYILQEDDFYKYVEPLQNGANYPAVTDKIIRDYYISLPPLSEQQRIVEELDELAEKVKEIEKLNNKLAAECDAMKQALLRQVFE